MTIISLLVIFLLLSFVLISIIFYLFYKYWFLRNPKINIPKGKESIRNIISPADGKVVQIIEFDEQIAKINKGRFGRIMAYTKDVASSGFVICISMNPFNLHYQRSPINGIVKKIKYRKGKFRNVLKEPSSLRFIENENNEILIEGTKSIYGTANKAKGKSNKFKSFNVKIIQIAGAFARRICCFANETKKVGKGDIIGLIKLGSMVVLIIPNNVELLVKEGQRVHVGLSTIARIRKKK